MKQKGKQLHRTTVGGGIGSERSCGYIEDASAEDGGVIVHKDTHSPMKVSKWDIIQ